MYDPLTSGLIRQAPALDGLDLLRLPEDLTRAYTQIVSARLAKQHPGKRTLERLRRLANAYQALAVVLPDSPQRKASAFVAASSHVLLHQAGSGRHRSEPQQLMPDAVAHETAALLLFIIAEQFPDATAVAARITLPTSARVEEVLSRAVITLGLGQMAIVESLPPPVHRRDLPVSEQALDALWTRLLEGVRALAAAVRGKRDASFEFASAIFEDVWNEAVQPLASLEEAGLGVAYAGFAGPHQLAGLLRGAAEAMSRAALASVPPPAGTDGKAWRKYVRRASKRRPFLWSNHLEAVGKGYLNSGVSAVLTFPTGAGKSALSELKIATTVSRGSDVVFLAPTHALVAQTVRDMRKAFPGYEVSSSFVEGGEYSEIEDASAQFTKGSIVVMTPERCLTIASLNPELFTNCGLVVFDEFHLMHPSQQQNLRRSIDATLCLLLLLDCAPEADVVLISAMLSNAKEISEWVTSATSRPCIPLDIRWKPTRQARGCVVYEQAALTALEQELKLSHIKMPKKKAPGVPELAKLGISPFSLVCLEQTWNTTDEHDYVLVPISSGNTKLSANRFWRLSPNRNIVARDLAAELGNAGIKTIVFVQKLDATFQIAQQCAPLLHKPADYAPEDKRLLNTIMQELGSTQDAFLPFQGKAACHHSLMTAEERELVEQVFRRERNLGVLVATATLAQGMNLPAEAVIIAGDDRFDTQEGSAEMLAAHELLNAAGRAGRAGQMPQGVVLVIPSKIVGVDLGKLEVGKRWHELRENILKQSDQCLPVADPVQKLLDAIHQRAQGEDTSLSSADLEYFVQRLPIGEQERSQGLLRKSLSAFFAAKSHSEQQFRDAVEEALAFRKELWKDIPQVAAHEWREDAAARMGVPLWTIDSIHERLTSLDPQKIDGVAGWLDVTCDWLLEKPLRVFQLQRLTFIADSFSDALGVTKKDFPKDEGTAKVVVNLIRDAAQAWITGSPLIALEKMLTTAPKRYCMRARHFTLRLIPDFSYTVGLFTYVARRSAEAKSTPEQMSIYLANAATCLREGVDDPRKLALREITRGQLGRVAVHESFQHIADSCPVPVWNGNYRLVKDTVAEAYRDLTSA